MKAAVLRDVGVLRIDDVATPEVQEDGVLLRVEGCAICGTDLRIYRHGHSRIRFPATIGHEVVGRISSMGSVAVNRRPDLHKGDPVAAFVAVYCGKCDNCRRGTPDLCRNAQGFGYALPGGFAEYMYVPGMALNNLVKLASDADILWATLAEPLSCCIHGQEHLEIGLDDTVLIIGAGPIGCMHAVLALEKGAKSVFMADISESRLKQVQDVDRRIVCLHSGSVDVKEAVFNTTAGAGASVVIVACSSPRAERQALEIAARRGRVSFFAGLPTGASMVELDANLIHYRELTVSGTFASTLGQFSEAIDLLHTRRIPAPKLITHVMPLERILDAYSIMESGNCLKIVITP